MECNPEENSDPKFLKENFELKYKKELEQIEELINEDVEAKIFNFISKAEKENPLIFDTEEKRNFFIEYLRKIFTEEKNTAVMIRNEMLNSFAQLDTIKNSVISGIPTYILNKKISEIKQQYFPEEVIAESLRKENPAHKPNSNAEQFLDQINIRVEKRNEESRIDDKINNDENNNNISSNRDLSFSKNKGIEEVGSILNDTRKATNEIGNKEPIQPDSSNKVVGAMSQNNATKNKVRSNLKSKQSSKKSLSDGEMDNEKSENKLNLKEHNQISNKKNLNNLSNLKNKTVNNLTKAPDNFTAMNYFSDNNLNKDYKKITKQVIEATPTFPRKAKDDQNEKLKENNNSRNHPVINNNIAKRYHSPSPAVSKIKKAGKVNKDQYKTPNKEK